MSFSRFEEDSWVDQIAAWVVLDHERATDYYPNPALKEYNVLLVVRVESSFFQKCD